MVEFTTRLLYSSLNKGYGKVYKQESIIKVYAYVNIK